MWSFPSNDSPAPVLQTRLQGAEHASTLTAKLELARALLGLGRPAQALQLAEPVLEVNRRLFGTDDETTVSAMTVLAEIYAAQGDYAKASDLAREALGIKQRTVQADSPDIADIQGSLQDYEKHLKPRSP